MKNNILIIDDEKIVCIALKMELEQEGYKVDFAVSADRALEMVKIGKYDLIFVDIVLPGIDGIEVCKSIEKIHPETTIIFMTGKVFAGSADEEVEFIEAGNNKSYRCLYKPFVKSEIIEVTKKALA